MRRNHTSIFNLQFQRAASVRLFARGDDRVGNPALIEAQYRGEQIEARVLAEYAAQLQTVETHRQQLLEILATLVGNDRTRQGTLMPTSLMSGDAFDVLFAEGVGGRSKAGSPAVGAADDP